MRESNKPVDAEANTGRFVEGSRHFSHGRFGTVSGCIANSTGCIAVLIAVLLFLIAFVVVVQIWRGPLRFGPLG